MSSTRKRRHRFERGLSVAAILAVALCGLRSAPAKAAGPAVEYSVKAAFLLNFTKFIEWPASAFPDAQSPIEICVLGRDPFGRVLEEVVQGETVAGRKVVTKRITQVPPAQSCQVLFIDPEWTELRFTLEKVPEGVLTVGDGDHFIHDGGVIAFVIDNRRVRFDINRKAAESQGLKLSAKLMGVARTVTQ